MTRQSIPKPKETSAPKGADGLFPANRDLDFNGLFNRFAPYVATVALRLVGDDALVDDIVQDVFLDCFRSFDTLHDLEHARRWLVKVTVRKTRRRLQKRKLMQLIFFSSDSLPDLPGNAIAADEHLLLTQLFRTLSRLPVNHRMAWSLRVLQGEALGETAEALGCSLATAKRWIRAAQSEIEGGLHE